MRINVGIFNRRRFYDLRIELSIKYDLNVFYHCIENTHSLSVFILIVDKYWVVCKFDESSCSHVMETYKLS